MKCREDGENTVLLALLAVAVELNRPIMSLHVASYCCKLKL